MLRNTLGALVLALPLLACGGGGGAGAGATSGGTTPANLSSGGTSSGATSSSSPTCGDVCAHLDQLCGSAQNQGCGQACPSFSAATRACLANLSSCAGMGACQSGTTTSSGGTGSGSSSTTSSSASSTTSSSGSSGGTGTTEIACHPPQVLSGSGPVSCASGCQEASVGGVEFCTHPCRNTADCSADDTASTSFVCDGLTGLCAVACGQDADCSRVGLTHCDTTAHLCD